MVDAGPKQDIGFLQLAQADGISLLVRTGKAKARQNRTPLIHTTVKTEQPFPDYSDEGP